MQAVVHFDTIYQINGGPKYYYNISQPLVLLVLIENIVGI